VRRNGDQSIHSAKGEQPSHKQGGGETEGGEGSRSARGTGKSKLNSTAKVLRERFKRGKLNNAVQVLKGKEGGKVASAGGRKKTI